MSDATRGVATQAAGLLDDAIAGPTGVMEATSLHQSAALSAFPQWNTEALAAALPDRHASLRALEEAIRPEWPEWVDATRGVATQAAGLLDDAIAPGAMSGAQETLDCEFASSDDVVERDSLEQLWERPAFDQDSLLLVAIHDELVQERKEREHDALRWWPKRQQWVAIAVFVVASVLQQAVILLFFD